MEALLTTRDLHEDTEFSARQNHLDVETALPTVDDHAKGTYAQFCLIVPSLRRNKDFAFHKGIPRCP